MGKAPAFQFYVRDWLSDPQLKMASFSTKGIWIDVLCYMWEAPERGIIKGTKEQLSRMIGTNNGDELTCFIDECKQLRFCDIFVTDNGIITLCNRRMHRDEKDRKNNRIRQQRHRDKQKHNGEITPLSSSSSSSSKKQSANAGPFKNAKDYLQDLWKQVKEEGEKVYKLRKDFNVAQWINMSVKKKYHPQAILETLQDIQEYIPTIKNPVAYCNSVLKTKSGKEYLKESVKEQQEMKKFYDDIIRSLSSKAGK